MTDYEEASEKSIEDACAEFKKAIDEINLPLYKRYDKDVEEILRNIIGTVRYERLNPHGPRLGPITKKSPLVRRYFTIRRPKNPDGTDGDVRKETK